MLGAPFGFHWVPLLMHLSAEVGPDSLLSKIILLASFQELLKHLGLNLDVL